MDDTVFYSWQDDLPRRENRELIRQALEAAVEQITAELGVEDALRLDQDTKGVPGNPIIVDTILAKIRGCRVFAPDLTFVATTAGGKKVPNPNVLLELGFALEALGDRKSLIVMNRFHGSPDELPFDLGNRRWPITYTLAPKSSKPDLQAARSDLQRQFVNALRTLLAEPSSDVATAQVEITYEKVKLESDEHIYDLLVRIKNTGPKVIQNWHVDLLVPKEVLMETKYAREIVDRATDTHRFFREDNKGIESLWIYQQDEKVAMKISYHVNREIFSRSGDIFPKEVVATVYLDDEDPIVAQKPVRELQKF